MREIGVGELRDIAVGAAVLGAGGGGDPYIGRLLAEQAIRRHGPVTLVSPDEVPDDALVAASCMMGAPAVMLEKMPAGHEAASALRALGEVLGRPITHAVSVEAGGLNSMIPFLAAAELGIPVVDADAMGRAFPMSMMTLPGLYGIPATPSAMTDERGNSVVLDTADNLWAERLGRNLCTQMGCSATVARYSMTGTQVRDVMVLHTITLCERIGQALRSARAAFADPIAAVSGAIGGRTLFGGKVMDVERRTEGGFNFGRARLDGLGTDLGSGLLIEFQNENLAATRDGVVLATVPDLICVLDTETGEPITSETLRFGQRVTVIGAPCDPRWRSPEGLALTGPTAFGYDHPYSPVETC